MTFSEAIIKLRSNLRISQKELASDLNVSCATVNRWENGRTVPHKMTLFVIHDYCIKNDIQFAYDENAVTDERGEQA